LSVVVGELIAERYELEELVGTGGMSSVYRAHDRMLERDVALKVLHQEFTADTDYVERFRREARSVAQLSHANIVTVIDRGEQDGRQYIVFEYVKGENLKALVQRAGPLPEEDAVRLALQIARALGFAHDNGLVHRDVKPQNVLLNGDGQAKVTDFGIARSLDVGGLTQTGTVMGTSDYIAPEQARGSQADAQSDIYSLGAVLYELLTGEVPFPGDNFVAVAMRHINEPPPSVRERRPDVSPRVDAAIRKAMAKEPRDRFRSMDELCGELNACLSPETGASGAQTMVVPRRRARADRPSVGPLILLLAGLAVLAAILGGVFAFTDSGTQLSDLVGNKKSTGTKAGPVKFTAGSSYDPFGDNKDEHGDRAREAIDGNPATAWNTEHYDGGLNKQGVGLVLGLGSAKQLTKLVVRSNTPGFTAKIESGLRPTGPFRPISDPQEVGGNTTFTLNGDAAQYYVVWITDLGSNSSVEINEVKGS
jgi:eukaryotic-like serine/threonine-protein kinase